MKMAIFFTFALVCTRIVLDTDNYSIMRNAPIVSLAMQELHIACIPELCISIILVQRELRISGIRELRVTNSTYIMLYRILMLFYLLVHIYYTQSLD